MQWWLANQVRTSGGAKLGEPAVMPYRSLAFWHRSAASGATKPPGAPHSDWYHMLTASGGAKSSLSESVPSLARPW